MSYSFLTFKNKQCRTEARPQNTQVSIESIKEKLANYQKQESAAIFGRPASYVVEDVAQAAPLTAD